MAVVMQHREAIASAAQHHDLPPEFLAAIIHGHQRGAEELIHDPFAMTLIMSEYRAKPQATANESSKLSGNAIFDLRQLMAEELYIFGRDAADAGDVRDAVTDYLEYIYCNSGMFNTSVCDDWNKR
jgi:hypothetical protein